MNEKTLAPAAPIKTWRDRIGAGADFPLHGPTDVERAMEAEIAELRSGAAQVVGRAAPDGTRVDAIVTALYRRFKEWSKRGFSADDVTWCEVKADVLALIAVAPAAPAVEPDEDGERWRFMMTALDNSDGPEHAAMERFTEAADDDGRPESAQVTEATDKARASLKVAVVQPAPGGTKLTEAARDEGGHHD